MTFHIAVNTIICTINKVYSIDVHIYIYILFLDLLLYTYFFFIFFFTRDNKGNFVTKNDVQ